MLERERAARAERPRSPASRAGERRRAVRVDERRDPVELGLGDTSGYHPRTGLVELVSRWARWRRRAGRARAAGGRRRRSRSPRGRLPSRPRQLGALARRKPEHPLGEVAVRAALEERERAVREPAHVVHRRRGISASAGSSMPSRGRRRRQLAEERELQLVVGGFGSRLEQRSPRRVGSYAIDAHEDEPRVAALELDRLVARRRRPSRAHRAARAPSRSASRGRRLRSGIDRAGDDQTVDRPRHRDVVEAQPLLAAPARAPPPRTSLVAEHRLAGLRASGCTIRNPKRPSESATISSRPARPADVAPRVRDDHDLELEPLRGVDREQPNRAGALLLGDRFELLRAERLLLADEADEPGDVGAANRLVVAREPTELAQVREAARAVPAREDGEVVVVLGEDPLAERLEPARAPTRARAARSAGGTREAARSSLGRDVLGQRPLERREERPARARSAGAARACRSRRRRTATRARSRAPRRRSGCAGAAGTRGDRRPAAARSSRARSRGTSAAPRGEAPPRSARRRCRRRRGRRSRPASPHPSRRARARASRSLAPLPCASARRCPR